MPYGAACLTHTRTHTNTLKGLVNHHWCQSTTVHQRVQQLSWTLAKLHTHKTTSRKENTRMSSITKHTQPRNWKKKKKLQDFFCVCS